MPKSKLIYLDYNATTPVDPEVYSEMEPYFIERFGNPASGTHIFGWYADAAVKKARKQIAELIHAQEDEIIFTSGATESNNLAILGLARSAPKQKNHIITVRTEHESVLDPCRYLESHGFKVSYLRVDNEGYINLEELESHIQEHTLLISVMAANNEIGTCQNLLEISKIAKKYNVLLHSDAAQAFGKTPLNLAEITLDFMSISGHKIYGPKGVGALFIRHKVPAISMTPLQFGGGHEKGLRSGTLNVAGIVGLGAASRIAHNREKQDKEHYDLLRNTFWESLRSELDNVYLNGPAERRLPNNLNISFIGIKNDLLIRELRKIALSSRSACSSGSAQASHVLRALQLSPERIESALRFSFGRHTSLEEVQEAASLIIAAVQKLRHLMTPPFYASREKPIPSPQE